MKTNRTWARTVIVVSAAAVLAGGLMPGCVQRVERERLLADSRSEGDRALRLGEFDEAAGWYEQYLEERPARPGVMYHLGLAYEGMGEPSAAREALSVAHELDPDEPAYIEALARNMAKNGETDAALDMLERIAAESKRADAHRRLGRFLLDQGFADEGVRVLRAAAELDPGADAWLGLAEAYRSFGDDERELGALRHAAWFDPENAMISSRVRSLGGVPGPTFGRPPPEPDLGRAGFSTP